MKPGKTTTASTTRAIAGVGTVIDTHHEGGLKRRTEDAVVNREDKNTDSKKKVETGMLNPSFLHTENKG